MALLDLTPRALDIRLYEGDDPSMQLTFWTTEAKVALTDLTGFTGWAATIRAPSGATAAFTVDTSSQASSVIVLELDGDDIRGFPRSGCRWDLRALDGDGREVTWMRGRVMVRPDVTA